MRLLGSPRSKFAGTPIAKTDFSSIWTMFSIWSFTDRWTFYREQMNFKRDVFVRASNCPSFDAQIQQGINSTFQAGLHQITSLNKPSELNSVSTVINKEVYNAPILSLLKPNICTYNMSTIVNRKNSALIAFLLNDNRERIEYSKTKSHDQAER